MYIYKVLLDPTGYTLIEADYFYVTKDAIDDTHACFYVTRRGDEPVPSPMVNSSVVAGNVDKEVLVGYVRNPLAVQLDTVYEAKPYSYQKSWAIPGMTSVDGNITLDILYDPVYRG